MIEVQVAPPTQPGGLVQPRTLACVRKTDYYSTLLLQ